jgi:hypothetical protein
LLAAGDPRAVLAETAVMLAARADAGSESAARDLAALLARIEVRSGVPAEAGMPNAVDRIRLRREALAVARGWSRPVGA